MVCVWMSDKTENTCECVALAAKIKRLTPWLASLGACAVHAAVAIGDIFKIKALFRTDGLVEFSAEHVFFFALTEASGNSGRQRLCNCLHFHRETDHGPRDAQCNCVA